MTVNREESSYLT